MLNWLLSLILPAVMASEALKRPLEKLSTTGEGVDNPKSK
jgi:hypothetical protein